MLCLLFGTRNSIAGVNIGTISSSFSIYGTWNPIFVIPREQRASEHLIRAPESSSYVTVTRNMRKVIIFALLCAKMENRTENGNAFEEFMQMSIIHDKYQRS
jgi:hypothetical protein